MSRLAASAVIAILGLHVSITPAGGARGAAPGAVNGGGQASDVDRGTPLAAAQSLWRAVDTADVVAIQVLLHAESPAEREMVAAIAELLVAGELLRRDMEQRFGEAGVGMGRRMIEMGDLEAVKPEAVKVEGERATISMAGASRPLELRRSAGGWRLVVIRPEGGRPPATVERIALVWASAQALNEAAAEVQSGRHATAEAAAAAVQQKLHAVQIAAHQQRPTTQPAATQPAATPAPTPPPR